MKTHTSIEYIFVQLKINIQYIIKEANIFSESLNLTDY